MPSRECAVDFGVFLEDCFFVGHVTLFSHFTFSTDRMRTRPPQRPRKKSRASSPFESSASQCPSIFARVPVGASRNSSDRFSCVRSGEFAKERGPGGARASHFTTERRTSLATPTLSRTAQKARPRRRRRGAPARRTRRTRLVSGAARPISFSPFKARPPSLRASPHRSVARAAPFADAPRLPEPPSRHIPWLTKARFPPSCAITAPAWSRCVPDHPRAPCERHRRSSGVPSAARF